ILDSVYDRHDQQRQEHHANVRRHDQYRHEEHHQSVQRQAIPRLPLTDDEPVRLQGVIRKEMREQQMWNQHSALSAPGTISCWTLLRDYDTLFAQCVHSRSGIMPSPSVTFGFILATLYGALFHLVLGGNARQLALYLLAGWLGFT